MPVLIQCWSVNLQYIEAESESESTLIVKQNEMVWRMSQRLGGNCY